MHGQPDKSLEPVGPEDLTFFLQKEVAIRTRGAGSPAEIPGANVVTQCWGDTVPRPQRGGSGRSSGLASGLVNDDPRSEMARPAGIAAIWSSKASKIVGRPGVVMRNDDQGGSHDRRWSQQCGCGSSVTYSREADSFKLFLVAQVAKNVNFGFWRFL